MVTSTAVVRSIQAYLNTSDNIREVIDDMLKIVDDPKATEDEVSMAELTIVDALFPHEPIDLTKESL